MLNVADGIVVQEDDVGYAVRFGVNVKLCGSGDSGVSVLTLIRAFAAPIVGAARCGQAVAAYGKQTVVGAVC